MYVRAVGEAALVWYGMIDMVWNMAYDWYWSGLEFFVFCSAVDEHSLCGFYRH